jgi:Tfp pilus assembly protein PilO
VALLLAADFVFFGYMPVRQRLWQISRSREAQQTAITKGLTESEQIALLKSELLELQKTVGDYDTSIPAQRALGEFLNEMADLMNKYEMTEQEVEPESEIKAGVLGCIPISIQCKGNLGRIVEFFRSLQSIGRLVRIEQVQLINDRTFSGQVSMQAKAVIYYRTKTEEG